MAHGRGKGDGSIPARAAASWGALALLAVMAWPAARMLSTMLRRWLFPYELEWLEGESAMQAWRFAQDPALGTLFPPYGEGDHTPHLYTPLYHILFGTGMRLLDSAHLGIGRGISIAATMLTMAGIFVLVHQATRDRIAAGAGALAWGWFYFPSGFWFDLARVDSLAWCLAIWSCVAWSARRGGWRWAAAGAVLALLAYFAKQSAIMLPLALLLGRMGLESVAALSGGRPTRQLAFAAWQAAFAALAAVAAWLALRSGAFADMRLYTVEMPARHGLNWDYLALGGSPQVWRFAPWWVAPCALGLAALAWSRTRSRADRVRQLAWAVAFGAIPALAWVVGSALPEPGFEGVGAGGAGTVGPHAVAFVAGSWTPWAAAGWIASAAAFGFAAGGWRRGGRRVRGLEWIVAAAMVQHAAVVSFLKVGAFVNNLMPLFLVLCILFGLGMAWIARATPRLIAGKLPAGPAARQIAMAALAILMAAGWMGGGFDHRREGFPIPQVPSARSIEIWDARRARIAELDADGRVYSPSHNYLNLMAGAFVGHSAFAIYDIVRFEEHSPPGLLADLKAGRWQWIVLAFPLEEEVLPADFRDAMALAYELDGPLLPEDFWRETDWMWSGPRMGWGAQPTWVYRRRGSAE